MAVSDGAVGDEVKEDALDGPAAAGRDDFGDLGLGGGIGAGDGA
ncbi:hypothetical protein ES707_14849 [subsurface metagenome]